VNSEVELVELPPHLTGILPQDNLFALRVKGVGLQDFLFAEGDILLFIRGLLAKADEVVVVWSEAQQELTLKKWENSNKGVTVLGRLLGAIRTTA
jgi:SOS-response transcriptional repressor LexA